MGRCLQHVICNLPLGRRKKFLKENRLCLLSSRLIKESKTGKPFAAGRGVRISSKKADVVTGNNVPGTELYKSCSTGSQPKLPLAAGRL